MTKCICHAGCDCQNPDPKPGSARLISENCPVHNWRPYPVPGCPVVGIHVNGAIDSDDTVQAPKRTREEAAEMVLRSMVADMRRQGWSLSNESADQMVAKLSAEILALPATPESE